VIIFYSVSTNNLIGEQDIVLAALKAHLPPDDVHQATQAFLRFYTRRGPFKEDATIARPAHTKEALPTPDNVVKAL
jgi:hypothetical protein